MLWLCADTQSLFLVALTLRAVFCGTLTGDVKKLTDHTPEYRLRVGDYRVLFEVEGSTVVVYRVLHRKDAYQ